MPIEIQDDYLHKDRTDHPYWNESAWFSFMEPSRDLSGFVYFHHRPNMGYTMGGVAAWDPSGDETWKMLTRRSYVSTASSGIPPSM